MMSNWDDYELLDFGADSRGRGRRLERFGALLLDRPCPAADGIAKSEPSLWGEAVARYDGTRATDGRWKPAPKGWAEQALACQVPVGRQFSLGLTPTPAGQIGLFPEQFTNWRWIHEQLTRVATAQRSHRSVERPLRVLNLFAYTGGSTLAAAVAGSDALPVEVTHVDASKPSVQLARENAERSGLAKAPIRWIVEDAVRYCEREIRRESKYDGVILDPPSYGHGPKGEDWRVDRDLPHLLALCAELTSESRSLFLATCHTPGIGPAELSAYLSDAVIGHCGQPPAAGRLWLKSLAGEQLESGVYARWPR